ncbi:MAG: DUF6273 domain-containing protein [Bacilli bacterium]|nr:DUF6273 domain-containing protein [Bacilli bacterium]
MKRFWITSALTIFFLTSCGSTPSVVKKYTITWKDWDGTLLATNEVEENHTPVYKGDIPTRESSDENYDYVYSGWDKEIAKATEDTTYTATYDHNFLYGSYPQKLVLNPQIVEGEPDEHGYRKDEQGNLYYKFKASKDYTTDDNIKIKEGDENYYLVKPIEWKILKDETTKLLCTTYRLLITQPYKKEEAEATDKENVYSTSDIRAWLNEDTASAEIGGFYGRMNVHLFDSNWNIENTEVINNEDSTCDKPNPFAENSPTHDDIFVLSRQELRDPEYGFFKEDNADKARLALTTDFARASGAAYNKNYGLYWTRSPCGDIATYYDTTAYSVMSDGHIIQHLITEGSYCARPAINFTKKPS